MPPSRAQRRAGTDPTITTGPKRLAVLEKERQALELRKAGATFEAIATQVGYTNPSAAHKAVKRAMDRTIREPADELRALESERLDRMLLTSWKLAIAGDLKAVDRVLKVIELRARLFGLATVPAQTGDEHAVSVIGQIGAALQAAAAGFAAADAAAVEDPAG